MRLVLLALLIATHFQAGGERYAGCRREVVSSYSCRAATGSRTCTITACPSTVGDILTLPVKVY